MRPCLGRKRRRGRGRGERRRKRNSNKTLRKANELHREHSGSSGFLGATLNWPTQERNVGGKPTAESRKHYTDTRSTRRRRCGGRRDEEHSLHEWYPQRGGGA